MHALASCLPGSTTFGMKEMLKVLCDLYGMAISDAEFTDLTQHIRAKFDRENFPSLIEVLDTQDFSLQQTRSRHP